MVKLNAGSQPSSTRGLLQIGSILAADTILYDGFESTLVKFTKSDVAGIGAISRDVTTAIAGEASLKVLTGALANNNTEAADTRGINLLGFSGYVRISVWIKINMAAAGDNCYIAITHRGGGVNQIFKYRILCTAASTGKFQYWTTAGAWADLTTAIPFITGGWYYLEFDIDLAHIRYRNVSVGNAFYVNTALGQSGADTGNYDTFVMGSFTGEAVAKAVYFDELLIRVV